MCVCAVNVDADDPVDEDEVRDRERIA